MATPKVRRSLAPVFDMLIAQRRAKNDAQIARALCVSPPVVSKARAFDTPIGPSIILLVHETYGIPIADIKAAILTEQKP